MTSIRGSWIAAVLGLSVFAAFTTLSAQPPPSLAPGQRVRVTAPSAGLDRTVGTVWAVRGREIVLEPDSPRPAWSRSGYRADSLDVAVWLDSVRSLEVSVGRHGHFWAGAGIGAAIAGTGFGFLAGSGGIGTPDVNPAVVAGAVLGGVVGGIFGASVVTDDWANVPLSGARIGVIVAPGRRLGLGASLAL